MKWPLNCFVCCCIYATYTDKYDSLLGLFVHKICKMMSNCNFLCQRRHLTLLYYYVVSEFVCVCEMIRWVHTFSIILLMHNIHYLSQHLLRKFAWVVQNMRVLLGLSAYVKKLLYCTCQVPNSKKSHKFQSKCSLIFTQFIAQ